METPPSPYSFYSTLPTLRSREICNYVFVAGDLYSDSLLSATGSTPAKDNKRPGKGGGRGGGSR